MKILPFEIFRVYMHIGDSTGGPEWAQAPPVEK